jgi:hypothetical protein
MTTEHLGFLTKKYSRGWFGVYLNSLWTESVVKIHIAWRVANKRHGGGARWFLLNKVYTLLRALKKWKAFLFPNLDLSNAEEIENSTFLDMI